MYYLVTRSFCILNFLIPPTDFPETLRLPDLRLLCSIKSHALAKAQSAGWLHLSPETTSSNPTNDNIFRRFSCLNGKTKKHIVFSPRLDAFNQRTSAILSRKRSQVRPHPGQGKLKKIMFLVIKDPLLPATRLPNLYKMSLKSA